MNIIQILKFLKEINTSVFIVAKKLPLKILPLII